MPLQQTLIIATLVVLAISVGCWSYKTDLNVSRQTTIERKVADFFSYNANIRDFNESGQLTLDLTVDSISHFPHNEITQLSNPDLWNYSGHTPWRTVAGTGRLLPDGETIELKKNVVMTQVEDGVQKLRMNTDFLTLYSGQDSADTHWPVTIISQNSVITANGMTLFYKQALIHLKSRVRGSYEAH